MESFSFSIDSPQFEWGSIALNLSNRPELSIEPLNRTFDPSCRYTPVFCV